LSRATLSVSTDLPDASLAVPNSQRALSARLLTVAPLALAIALFVALAAYQLDLPGLHYDEAKEAGVNAMQLLTGQPVTAFRDAAVTLGPWRVPLMVQDYIGNLNALLAVPFLAVGGINTPALRALPIALAALTIVFVWLITRRLRGPLAAAVAALLLAVSPSFVFWSRQGIFVTNITALLFMAALWTGLLWWEERRTRHLLITAFLCGLGIYAKLLFVWAALALLAVAAAAYLVERRAKSARPLGLNGRALAAAIAAFALPLTPLILFNLRTGGTFASIFGNLGSSYYGVDNSAYGPNLLARLGQVDTLLRGGQFWYLGETRANPYAPWLLLGVVALAFAAWLACRKTRGCAGRAWFTPALPIALLLLIVLQSAFTVSDLFITHFALIAPLPALIAGLSAGEVIRALRARWASTATLRVAVLAPALAAALIVLALGLTDLRVTIGYHRILTVSGGYAAHSDAVYRLADYLDQRGYTAPVALDWGIDAPVHFLTAGRVQPIDVFGYDRIDGPDQGFAERLEPYMTTWLTVYISHAPDKTVFKGRTEAIAGWAAERSKDWMEEMRIAQRSGEPVFILHRYLP
jgi:4-amino-4-deoxy-L-arabinose transferase-like glycosyltransferase